MPWDNVMRPLIPLFLFLLVTGCQAPSSDGPESVVLATYRDGTVTVQDLDQYLVEAARQWTWDAERSSAEQLEELTRRVAVERLLTARADSEGTVPAEQVESRLRDIKRSAAARDALRRQPPNPVEREDLEEYLESQRERIDRPERRRVLHIFKRFASHEGRHAERADLERQLLELRDRALAGENFSLLARDHSDSETRHQEGILGEVVRGQFSEDFDSVVFAIDEGVPSEPVFTADGGHLFFVADILPERSFTVDDLGPMLWQELLRERQRQKIREIAEGFMDEAGGEILPESYFEDLLKTPNPPPVLFRVGDNEYRLEDFRRLGERNPRLRPEEGPGLLQRAYDEEVILHYGYEQTDGRSLKIPEAELARERRQVQLELYLDRILRQRVREDTENLRAHHERHAARFSRPVTVSMTRLVIPVEARSSPLMASLENSLPALNASELTLEALAQENGGRIQELREQTLAQLRAADPKAVQFAFALQPGEHAPPYSLGQNLILFRLDERREAEPRAFDEVQIEVAQDYLRLERQALYKSLSDEVLTEANFDIKSAELARGGRLLARLPN